MLWLCSSLYFSKEDSKMTRIQKTSVNISAFLVLSLYPDFPALVKPLFVVHIWLLLSHRTEPSMSRIFVSGVVSLCREHNVESLMWTSGVMNTCIFSCAVMVWWWKFKSLSNKAIESLCGEEQIYASENKWNLYWFNITSRRHSIEKCATPCYPEIVKLMRRD